MNQKSLNMNQFLGSLAHVGVRNSIDNHIGKVVNKVKSEKMLSPFHLFSTQKNHYIYSSLTNDIIIIDKLTSEILNSLFVKNEPFSKLKDSLKEIYSLDQILKSSLLVKSLFSKEILSYTNNVQIQVII